MMIQSAYTPSYPINSQFSGRISSTVDGMLSDAIAMAQLVPIIDEFRLRENFPRTKYKDYYRPHQSWVKTPDNKYIRTYFLPAIDPQTNRIMANSDGKSGLGSKETVVMAHGYKSSPTAQMTVANSLRLLGQNVLTYDARGHGDSSGFFRGGYTTAIGFNAPIDLGTVVRDFKEKHPEQRLGGYGYSMGASGIMFYPKRLAYDSLSDSQKYHIKPKDLKSLQDAIESFEYVVLDAPYDTFDLMTNPVMMKKLNALAKTNIAKRAFGSEDKARNRIIEILRHFNEEGSKRFLGIPVPFRDFKPIDTYKGSKLAEEKPSLLLHGEHDEDTLPAAHENIKKSGIVKDGKFVLLDAGHSEQSLVDPKNPTSKRRYWQMLRDPKKYIATLTEFLANNKAIDAELIEKPTVKEKLKDPNKSTLISKGQK